MKYAVLNVGLRMLTREQLIFRNTIRHGNSQKVECCLDLSHKRKRKEKRKVVFYSRCKVVSMDTYGLLSFTIRDVLKKLF